MLKEYLTKDRIKLRINANDWRDVVNKVGKLMQDLGDIEKDYTTAMLNAISELGPYSVVSPGVVLLHARPENGVNKVGMVLMTLRDGVDFGSENDPVRIAIGLCAVDQVSHIELLQDLAVLLQDEKLIKKLIDFEQEDVSKAQDLILNNHNEL